MSKIRWAMGDKSLIARKAGITPQRLSNILARRDRATPEQAVELEDAAISLGYKITREDWIYCKETSNVLFKEVAPDA